MLRVEAAVLVTALLWFRHPHCVSGPLVPARNSVYFESEAPEASVWITLYRGAPARLQEKVGGKERDR